MSFPKLVSSAVFAVFMGGAGALAQGLGAASLPAEFPPASFKGKQFADSRGCVFIRAGVDGNVTWVPRLTRAREHICGAQPTFAKAQPAPEPVAQPAPEPKKVAEAPKPTVKVKPAPVVVKPALVTVSKTTKPKVAAPTIAPMKTVATTKVAQKPAKAAPKRVAPTALAVPAATSSCPQFGPSGQFMTGAGLRCGPQAESPVTFGSAAGGAISAPPVIRAVPSVQGQPQQQAVVQQVPRPSGVSIPKGYRPVWTDDRLNPNRGPQNALGQAQMELVWTNTVPRKLVEKRSGRDVSRANPNVVYPYTDLATQQRTEAMKIIQTQPNARVGTKGQSPSKPDATKGKAYVQVGTFGVPANAQKTAKRLQSAGMPVRIGRYAKSGKQYQIVMAGPFATSQQLNAALATARRAGFRDAFLR